MKFLLLVSLEVVILMEFSSQAAAEVANSAAACDKIFFQNDNIFIIVY